MLGGGFAPSSCPPTARCSVPETTYGEPWRSSEGAYWRTEYGADGGRCSIMLLDLVDDSYAESFDKDHTRCSMCWLGYPHSRRLHWRRVQEWVVRHGEVTR